MENEKNSGYPAQNDSFTYSQLKDNQPVSPSSGVSTVPGKKRGCGLSALWLILLFISTAINVVLLAAVIFVLSFAASGADRRYTEKTTQGTGDNKIAVLSIEGLIDDEMAADFREQIERAAKDKSVRAVIIRTSTPGGLVGASDRIHNEIKKFRTKTGRPAVAFMQSLATSGGYYTSVACDKIIAEPATITGSIGVIMGHFVFQNLFENKLGIKPVIIKSGIYKDWPTSFSEVTPQQEEYVQSKIIRPAYNRFVKLISENRSGIANLDQLADGSIYYAEEARQNKLIDEIGYEDLAIELAKSLAGISEAKVVEYRRSFSLVRWLESRNMSKIFSVSALSNLTTPQVMYIWHAGL